MLILVPARYRSLPSGLAVAFIFSLERGWEFIFGERFMGIFERGDAQKGFRKGHDDYSDKIIVKLENLASFHCEMVNFTLLRN